LDDHWTKPIDFNRFQAAIDALAAARTPPAVPRPS